MMLREKVRRQLRDRPAAGAVAVSYTHLDVYKRQIQRSLVKKS